MYVYTYQYPNPGRFRFGRFFLLLRTIYKRANVQQVRSKASKASESWPRIGNIDPFFVTAAPIVANESFSLSEYAIPVNEVSAIGKNRTEKKRIEITNHFNWQVMGLRNFASVNLCQVYQRRINCDNISLLTMDEERQRKIKIAGTKRGEH